VSPATLFHNTAHRSACCETQSAGFYARCIHVRENARAGCTLYLAGVTV